MIADGCRSACSWRTPASTSARSPSWATSRRSSRRARAPTASSCASRPSSSRPSARSIRRRCSRSQNYSSGASRRSWGPWTTPSTGCTSRAATRSSGTFLLFSSVSFSFLLLNWSAHHHHWPLTTTAHRQSEEADSAYIVYVKQLPLLYSIHFKRSIRPCNSAVVFIMQDFLVYRMPSTI